MEGDAGDGVDGQRDSTDNSCPPPSWPSCGVQTTLIRGCGCSAPGVASPSVPVCCFPCPLPPWCITHTRGDRTWRPGCRSFSGTLGSITCWVWISFPGSSSGCCSPVTQVPESTTVSPASLPSLPNKSWAVPAPPASRQTLLPPAGQLPWFPDTRNRTYPGWEERKEWCQSLPVPGEGLSRCKKGHSCPRAESFLRA